MIGSTDILYVTRIQKERFTEPGEYESVKDSYTITPRMFVSGILQYNSASTSVGSNLRFRWEYQPGSELFVVYTDDYDSDPRPNAVALRNRAFVVKFNRLFRL